MEQISLNIENPLNQKANINLFANDDSLLYFKDSSNYEFAKDYDKILNWNKELYPELFFKKIFDVIFIYKSQIEKESNTNAIGKINLSTGELIELPTELELRTETFNYNGGYTMFYRAVIGEDKTIYNTFSNAPTHTTHTTYFIFRKSTNGGLTFTGVDGVSPYDAVSVNGLGTDKIHNPAPVMLRNNRIAVFFQIYNSSEVRYIAGFVYSDDGGVTWSDMIYIPNPTSIPERYSAPFYIAAEPIYLENGNFILPNGFFVNGAYNETVCMIAEFEFINGEYSINPEYSIIYDGRGSDETLLEVEWTDCGNGEITAICRTMFTSNYKGDNSVPVMLHSTNYGKDWGAGSETALSLSNIENSLYNSGYAYFEGLEISMGDIDYYNNCLPTINAITVDGEKWLLVNYWVREEMSELFLQTIQRISIIKYSDYKLMGVDAIKSISITLFDEPVENVGNENGGNGNAIVYGQDLLFFQYTQPTLTTTAWTVPIKKTVIDQLITAYNNA